MRNLFPARHRKTRAAKRLLDQIMVQARSPILFGDKRLPDTLEGRAKAVALYSALVISALDDEGQAGRALSEKLINLVFDSFDAALRETGVGDASISRQNRKLGESFSGIGKAVKEALLTEDGEAALADVLIRNQIASNEALEEISVRLQDAFLIIRNLPSGQLLSGDTGW